MKDKKQPFMCKMGFHDYSVWGDKFKIPNARFEVEFQQKKCLKCGHIKERMIGAK